MDKIICVGKNYLEHAKELGDAVPERPILFLKPPSTLIVCSGEGPVSVPLPKNQGEVHPECEIVARIRVENGMPRIDAVTLGLDSTLRNVQARLKENGHPWEISKVFEGSSVIGPWIPLSGFAEYLTTPFHFIVDGIQRQKGLGSEMRIGPAECLRYASEHFPIRDGDLLFTGTPAGVGPVEPGQLGELRWGTRLRYETRFSFA